MNAWTQQYAEALSFDTHILCLVIERNRKQHYRASYFRRLDMLVRCMKRHNLLVDPGDKNSSLMDTLFSVKNEYDKIAAELERYKGLQKRRGHSGKVEDECWSLSKELKGTEYQAPFLRDLSAIYVSATLYLPEILSRIMFAASSLYTELSRGYFAPLCTVALGCISRIRVLILQFGRDAVLQLQKTIGFLENEFLAVAVNGGKLEKQTGLNVESVKAFINEYQLDSDAMNTFIDNNHCDQVVKMDCRKMEEILRRGESFTSLSFDTTQEKEKTITAQDSLSDMIGELIDTSACKPNVTKVRDITVIDEKNDGDRNLELVKLMKEKVKNEKIKKRKADGMGGPLSKTPRIYEDSNSSEKEKVFKQSTDSIKKKEKSKKKKKKGTKDVIDAIFDQL